INNWIQINQAIKSNKYRHNFLVINYENLISNPEITIKSICDFIEEPYIANLLDVEVINTNSSLKGQKGFNQKSLTKWQEELNIFEKIYIKILTNGLAKEFGY
ncbi:MAG: Sulfotransferase domain, partial [Cyanobacteriota bacterium]